MKIKSTLLIIACFTMLSTFGQNALQLNLVKDNDQPISKTEHFYLLEIKNNSTSNQVVILNSDNTPCSDISASKQVNLNHKFLNEGKGSVSSNGLTITPNATKKVYLKIFRPQNTKLNTWNCTKVNVSNADNSITSNSLTIKTLVPDPKDFN